jgi:hypothetical protein
MAITKPQRKPKDIEEFVARADPAPAAGFMRGNRAQITMTIAPELLRAVDAYATRIGVRRGPAISMLLSRALGREEAPA